MQPPLETLQTSSPADLSRSCSSRLVNSSLFLMNSPWFLFSSSSLYRACLWACSTISSCSSIRRWVSRCFSTSLSSCVGLTENIWEHLPLQPYGSHLAAIIATLVEILDCKLPLPLPWVSRRCLPGRRPTFPGWRLSAGPVGLSVV